MRQEDLKKQFMLDLEAKEVGKCEDVSLKHLYAEAEALLDLVGPRGMVSSQDYRRLYYAARQILGETKYVGVPKLKTLLQLIDEEKIV